MYRSITAYVPEDMADDLSAMFFYYGAEGVEVEDSSVKLMPGKEPPPEGKARLIGYFSPEGADAALRAALTEAVGEDVAALRRSLPGPSQPSGPEPSSPVSRASVCPLALERGLKVREHIEMGVSARQLQDPPPERRPPRHGKSCRPDARRVPLP